MKRKIVLLIIAAMLSACALCLAACGETAPPVHEHAWSDWKITRAPTCAAEGAQKRACKDCDEEEEVSLPPTDIHTWGNWKTVLAPTCIGDGLQRRTCLFCDRTEERPIGSAGKHVWSDWETIIEPTCKVGMQRRICTICQKAEDKIISATGIHRYTQTIIPPTETARGYTLHICDICGGNYRDGFERRSADHEHSGKVTEVSWKISCRCIK